MKRESTVERIKQAAASCVRCKWGNAHLFFRSFALPWLLYVLTACSGAPDCDDKFTVKLLEELWSPHANLIPADETFRTGSFSNFRDIGSEIDIVPSDARICEVEVFDLGGRVIRSRYEVSRDGIVAGENEVIKRFTPP